MLHNYLDKPLTQYTPADTVYMRKYVNGHPVHILVQFVKFQSYTVYGIIISVAEDQYKNVYRPGVAINAKASKCFSVYKQAYCFFNAKGEMVSRCKDF